MTPSTPMPDALAQLNVSVCAHALVKHNLAKLRDKTASPEAFRAALARLAQILLTEATQSLPLEPVLIETPLQPMQTEWLSPKTPIMVAPILRAGLMLSGSALELIPEAKVYHIGLYRNEATLQPVTYYNKLPQAHQMDYARAQVMILDPMLATGGSAIAAAQIFSDLGVPVANMQLVCVIAAPEGLAALGQAMPGMRVTTAAIDDCLNGQGYIVPGLGDAGDRAFGTY
ncbi:MAG: uracil phosphoribosyltransferase [Vampirovibrionales bacterium]|nr:uracil phosphoribosyltransferase [Vampirovibrionales bacterium]